MSFWNWLKKLGGSQEETIISFSKDDLAKFVDKEAAGQLSIYLLALNAGINLLASAISKCEIRTFVKGDERKGDEYYLWNYEPNRNQNASQFLQKLVWNLLFRGECLVVDDLSGGLMIAASFQHERYANQQDLFKGVTIDLEGSGTYQINRTFTMNEVLYYKYNNVNITDLLLQVMGEYEKLLKAAEENCIRSYGEHGILKIDAKAAQINYGKKEDGTPRTFNDVYREMMNDQFKSYFKNANAVMPLWEGMEYSQQSSAAKKSTSEIKDVQDITTEIYDRVANALQIPPALLKGDVADVEMMTRNMLTFAVDPIVKSIERENNRKRNGKKVLHGTYQMIDTSRIMHNEPLDVADKAFNLIGAGWSLDEIREKTGDAPLNTEWSRQHYLSLNFTQYENIGQDRKGDENETDTAS